MKGRLVRRPCWSPVEKIIPISINEVDGDM
jgi:hypothetical protein